MATMTLEYDENNKSAQLLLEFAKASGLIEIIECSVGEIEDLGLIQQMKNVDRTKKVSKAKVMKKLNK
jgi:hypothetical protein